MEPQKLETQAGDARRVPIIEISKESGGDTWSVAVEAVRDATFVAIDLVSSM